MPDFKYWSKEASLEYLGAADYPERARAAIAEMQRQVGVLLVDSEGLARRGLLLRHLLMPDASADSAAILRWLAREISPDSYLNLMGQYRPAHRVGRPGPEGLPQHGALHRRPSRRELAAARKVAREAGLWRLDGEV